ncbi:MAG: serine hydrolase [Bacteroidota bacterium]
MKNQIIILISCCLLVSSCHVGRFFTKFKANITDHKIFPYTEVSTGENLSRLPTSEKEHQFTIKFSSGKERDLDDYLQETTTVSFLVIQGDSILYEKYYQDYQPDDISNIFSVSKSVTSLLVGIAIDEGKINSIKDPVVNYIPELNDADPLYKELTIEDLLNMRSGLKFTEAYGTPFAHVARLYYGTNQMKQIKRLKFENEPGEVHRYQSISTSILGVIVERATNMELGEYLEQKVWQPMGMEFDATWSVDDKKHRSGKAFCCLNTTARDLAKIGLLYKNDGKWNGKQIVSSNWVQQSKTANMENDCYQYQWYAPSGVGYKDREELIYPDSLSAVQGATEMGYKHFYVDKKSEDTNDWHIHYCSEDFYALGILGQYLYVNPKNDLVFVRLGEKWDNNYDRIFRQIVGQVASE